MKRSLNKYPTGGVYREMFPNIPGVYINDFRKIRKTTGKPINPNRDLLSGYYRQDVIDSLARTAIENGVNPYRAIAQGLAETNLGFTDENVGHVLDGQITDSPYLNMINAIKNKDLVALKKGKIKEEDIIQAYNGYGKLMPSTEQKYHGFKSKSFYGVPIPKEGLDMNKNPLYGKHVLDIQKNIIEKSPKVNSIVRKYQLPKVTQSEVEQIVKSKWNQYPTQYEYGGTIKPIIVNNPKDPRLKAYNDSLFAYNKYKDKDEWVGGKNVLKFKNKKEEQQYNDLHKKMESIQNMEYAEQDKLWSDPNFKKLNQDEQFKRLMGISNKYTNNKSYKDIVARVNYLNTENTSVEGARYVPKWYDNKNLTVRGLKPISWDKKEYQEVQGQYNTTTNQYGTIIDRNNPVSGNKTSSKTIVQYSPNFKEPVQPVVYQPLKKQTAKAELVEPLYNTQPDLSIPEREQLSFQPKTTNTPAIQQQGVFKQGRKFMLQQGYTGNQLARPGWYEDGGVINNNMKRKLPKYSTGAWVKDNAQPIGMGAGIAANMAGSLIPDKTYTDEEGNDLGTVKGAGEQALQYGAQGLAAGAMFGPWGAAIGGGIGAGYGAIKGAMEAKEMREKVRMANIGIGNRKLGRSMTSNVNVGVVNPNTSTNFMFAKGGMVLTEDDPNASAELELQETFQLPDGTVGNVDGPSHEMGGIAVDLPEGTRIWSDKLKHNGKTFAKHTKPITNKIAKLEKQLESSNNPKAIENSIMLLNKQLDHYFNVQESNKQVNEMKRTLRNGGMIKRADGSYSKRGLWDNIRANKGSGKKPTPEMLKQEAKIRAEEKEMGGYIYADGGGTKVNFQTPNTNFEEAWLKQDTTPQYTRMFVPPSEPSESDFMVPEELYRVNAGSQQVRTLNTPLLVDPGKRYTANMNQVTPLGAATLPSPNISRPTREDVGMYNPNADMQTGTPNTSNWLKDNYGLVGQLGSAVLSAGIQSGRINRLARPRTLSNVRLSDRVATPAYVDYSAERNAIDRATLNAMSDAQRGFGSSAAAQAFKNKARLNQLEGTGKSFQQQSNVNTQIKNQFQAAQQEAAMKEAMINNEIEKYNLESIYGFDTMTAQQRNAITAMLANTAGQTFGTQTAYKNQLDQANILANQYDPSVLNDMIKNGRLKIVDGKVVKARYGGTMKKRSLKK